MKKFFAALFMIFSLSLVVVSIRVSLEHNRKYFAAMEHADILTDQIKDDSRFTNVYISGESSGNIYIFKIFNKYLYTKFGS